MGDLETILQAANYRLDDDDHTVEGLPPERLSEGDEFEINPQVLHNDFSQDPERITPVNHRYLFASDDRWTEGG